MQLISIQILRALAAIVVAIGHAQSFVGTRAESSGQTFGWSYALPWAAGVDLFFVISGFIMVYASDRLFARPGGARSFMWRRVTRIVPLYWGVMLFLFCKEALQHKPAQDAATLLTSIFFIPWDAHNTGQPRPYYELGWTLNYEMYFYAVFALFMGFARERAVALTTIALSVMVALGAMFQFSNPVLLVWTQPIVFEFAFGMGLALLTLRGVTLPDRARYALMALAAAAFSIDFLHSSTHPFTWITPNDFSRLVAWGVPAALLLASVTLAKRSVAAPGPLARAGAAVGDASYALYLWHPIIIATLAYAWFFIGLDRWAPPAVAVAMSVLTSIATALVIYRRAERPLTRYLQAKRPGSRGEATPRVAARPSL